MHYTNMNKAYPKDLFPLPHIDVLVDAIVGHLTVTFLDAFSGFYQIQMHPDNQEKTSFITKRGVYYINLCLRMRGQPTNQKLVNMMFKDVIGDTM